MTDSDIQAKAKDVFDYARAGIRRNANHARPDMCEFYEGHLAALELVGLIDISDLLAAKNESRFILRRNWERNTEELLSTRATRGDAT